MKKIYIFILLLTGALCSAVAQDTIYDSQLDGPYMMPTSFYPRQAMMYCHAPNSTHTKNEEYVRYFTDSSITVYGVAVTASLGYYYMYPDSMDYNCYLATISSWDPQIIFDIVDSFPMSPDIYPTTYFSYTIYRNFLMNDLTPVQRITPCYEFYFDKPHKLIDTFYVGFSVDNHSNFIPFATPNSSIYYMAHNSDAIFRGLDYQVTIGIGHHYERDTFGEPRFNQSIVNGIWGGIFPILQPDRPYCNPVGGLRVAERGQDYATLCWDNAGDSVYYQLVFGDDAANPIFTYDTCYTRTGLDTGIFYNAHLRRGCHHDCPYHPDSTLYSPWSPGVEFYLGSTNPDDIGIEHQPSVDFSIYPNPTAGQFSLSLTEGMEARVFIGDADGRSVYDQKATGSVMHFDLSALPTGNYTVTVDTPLGPCTKQLSIVK